MNRYKILIRKDFNHLKTLLGSTISLYMKRERSYGVAFVSVNLTPKCNLKCIECPKTLLGLRIKEDMSEEVLEKIIQLSRQVPLIRFLSIGEPLMYPKFLYAIERIKANGAGVDFTTNATLLDLEISKKLVKYGVDRVVFSIDSASPEGYEEIKKGAKFEVVIENIRRLANYKKEAHSHKPVLSINFVGMKQNIEELPKIIELSKDLGVEEVRLSSLAALLKEMSLYHIHEVPNDGKYYLEEAKRLSKKSKVFLLYKIDPKGPCLSQCIEPWIGPFIDPRGDVYPCNFLGTWTVLNQPVTLWYDETSLKINVDNFKLGNIMNQDLDEIWNSKKIFKLRKNIAKFENQDKRRNWNGESYIKLIFTRQNILDEMLNFCEVCPFRFGITH